MKIISTILCVCLFVIFLQIYVAEAHGRTLKLKLKRYEKRNSHIRGKLYYNGDFTNIYTMEQTWNQNNVFQSCVKRGTYGLSKIRGSYQSYNYDHLKLRNTGRSDSILIRCGTSSSNLNMKSHILVGKGFSNGELTHTRTAMDEVMGFYNRNWDKYELEIVNNF